MPIRAGEHVFVSGEVRDGWIFATKRSQETGEPLDEGWVPAMAVNPGSEVRQEQVRQEPVREPSPVQSIASEDTGEAAPSPERKAEQPLRRKAKFPQAAEAEAEWHEHGNWWSRQRHLRPAQPQAWHEKPRQAWKHAGWDEKPSQAWKQADKRKAPGASEAAGRRGPQKTVRERPSLNTTLDRLNKPLVLS